MIKSIGIFCGSSLGKDELYSTLTYNYVSIIVKNKIDIIYGGGCTGIMGIVAKAAIEGNGKIIGVVPKLLNKKGIIHQNLNKLIIVNSMLERKEYIINNVDAFVILPGGIGTLDEFFEVFTGLQLETINKPIGILNINGYYDSLINMLKTMVIEKFFRKEHLESLVIESDPEIFHKKLINNKINKVEGWIEELKKID